MKDIASESFETDTRDIMFTCLHRKSYPSVYQLPYGPGARVVGHTEWSEIGFGGAGPQYVPAA